jgi:hypothetical protein
MTARISIWKRALVAALLVGAAADAGASAGDGIRLGGSEGRLRPFLDLETRYDSNVSYADAEVPVGDVTQDFARPVGDLILHVRPGFELKAPGDLATVEFSGALDWAQYLGAEDSATSDLSKLYANAGLAVLLNRRGAVSVRLDDDYRRQVSTSSTAGAGGAPVVSDSNVLSLAVPLKPGGGALVVTGRGQWLIESFRPYLEDDDNSYDHLGYSEYRAGVDVQWRFLPRTSTVFQAGWFQRVQGADDPTVAVGATRPNDATGYDFLAGVTGLLTAHVGATAKLGYGATSIAATSGAAAVDSSSFVADVSLEWLPVESISVRAGYARSLGIDPTQATYVSNGATAGFRARIAQRFALRTDARWEQLSFERVPDAETTFLRIEPSIEGALGRWLVVGIGYAYSKRDATWPTVVTAGVAPPTDYSKNEAYLKLALTY